MTEWTKKEYDAQAANGVTVIDFWAPWCAPCRMMATPFAAVADAMQARARFVKVNIDENEDLANLFRISAIPTVAVVKDGVVKEVSVGLLNEQALTELVTRNL